METHNPIQQDWLSEYRADASCGVDGVQQAVKTPEPETPLGVTLPLFVDSNQAATPVVQVARLEQLQRQLRGSWVTASRPRRVIDLSSAQGASTACEKDERPRFAGPVDPVLEHLNSAMHLAESLRGPAKKRSYRHRKTTGVLICQHLVAALKLAHHDFDSANSQSIPRG